MTEIKTWTERCEEHQDHQSGIVTHQMIQDRMQEEIDELRAQPKYKLVDLNHAGRLFMEDKPGYKDGYNRAIDDIKSKYGDLYVVIRK